MAISSNSQKVTGDNEIVSGCQVAWKNDWDFLLTNQPQMSIFSKRYGYGPFFVVSVRGDGPYKFVTISTEEGEKEVNEYYLRLVRTSRIPLSEIDPIEMATD